nr:hypothetical protein BaRGS_021143 [Batillaria attramentaria]
MLGEVTVNVDETQARLTLIEAQQNRLEAENADLKDKNANLTQHVDRLSQENTNQANQLSQYHLENVNLTNYVHNLEAELTHFHETPASKRVSFHARLQTNQQVRGPNPVIMKTVLSNEVSQAVEWSPSPADGAVIGACVGQDVTLDWNYTLAQGETVEDIKWYITDGRSNQMIALFGGDNEMRAENAYLTQQVARLNQENINQANQLSHMGNKDKRGPKRKQADRGRMYQVEQENTSLKEELAHCRKGMEDAKRVADEAKYEAGVARAQAGDLEQYGRRYNVRVFGVKEDDDETAQQCEEKVLRIINEKLELKGIKSADVDAIHRLGKKPKPRRAEQNHSDSDSDTESRPRAIIVRFVSRKCTQDVLRNRRKLRGTKISIAEDLSRDRYRLLRQVKEKEVDDAWSRDGKIFVKVVWLKAYSTSYYWSDTAVFSGFLLDADE